MKTKKHILKIAALIVGGSLLFSFNTSNESKISAVSAKYANPATILAVPAPAPGENDIKIALLLDTSSSMNGLIEQAKSQLWKIVNQLAQAKKGGNYASLEIALYEYGNSRLSSRDAYVRQVVGLTNDLDEISKQLFSLTTSGGDEYCGEVIQRSISELEWQTESSGLQVVFIAGNEPFTQGSMPFSKACQNALSNNIIVNTIFCGDHQEGIRHKWKQGADITEGYYGSISMNEATVYVETPYDQQIEALNKSLNETYLAFGENKTYYQQNQVEQDNNSKLYGKSNMVERTISKSSHMYNNSSWDMVDAQKSGDLDLKSIKKEELPNEMKTMTINEQEAYVKEKAMQRSAIQAEIQRLNQVRTAFINGQNTDGKSNGLDYAMLNAIKAQAIGKSFTFDEPVVETISAIDYPGFLNLTSDVEKYRFSRLIDIKTFNQYSQEPQTIILDTRSKKAFDQIHLKGAVHLNFSEFTDDKLATVIPSKNTRILIYCNNNFNTLIEPLATKSVSLALNIPTFINLYGYGYKNIYELKDYLPDNDPRLEWEGSLIN